MTKHPKVGIRFFETVNKKPARGKPEQIWKYTDWCSIICSIMLQNYRPIPMIRQVPLAMIQQNYL